MNQNSFFRKWINNLLYPCGVVYSSEKAKNIIGKNNLTPAEFLRPFFDFKGKELTFNLSDKISQRLTNFRIDLYDSENFKKTIKSNSIQSLQTLLTNVLSNDDIQPNFDVLNKRISPTDCIEKSRLLSNSFYSNFHFIEIEKVIADFCRFDETEFYQQPLISIYICSLTDEISVIEKLKYELECPLIKGGYYFGQISKLLIVLNDISDKENFIDNEMKKFQILANIKKSFNNYPVLMLDINSLERYMENNQSVSEIKDNSPLKKMPSIDIWLNYLHKLDLYENLSCYEKYKKKNRGVFVSQSDVMEYKSKIIDLFEREIKKEIITFLQILENEISKEKKGINRMFSAFKKKEDNISLPYADKPFSVIEKKIYCYGIMLFYIGSHENVRGYLKLIKNKNKFVDLNLELLLCINSYLKNNITTKKKELIQLFYDYVKENEYIGAIKVIIVLTRMLESDNNFSELLQIYENFYDFFQSFQILNALFYEKISLYYIMQDNARFRYFLLSQMHSSNFYHALNSEKFGKFEMNCFSNFNHFLSETRTESYPKTKLKIYCFLKKICKENNQNLFGILYIKRCLDLSKKINYFAPEELRCMLEDLLILILSIESENERKEIMEGLDIFEIDNHSVVLFDQGNYEIYQRWNKESSPNFPSDNTKLYFDSFKKYNEYNMNKSFSFLSEKDLKDLTLLDNLLLHKEIRNTNLNKSISLSIGEYFYLYFEIKNPLNVTCDITNIGLICMNDGEEQKENTEDYLECENIQLSVKGLSKQTIFIKVLAKKKGILILKGITIILLNGIILSYYLDKKENCLLYEKYFKKENPISSSNFYKIEIIEKEKNIDINFPYGKQISIYSNSYFLFPIIVKSNTDKFKFQDGTVFISQDPLVNEENKIYLENYIFKESNFKNQVTFFIPLLPKKAGKTKLKVIIKLEDENKMKDVPIKKFLIDVTSYCSINFAVNYCPLTCFQDKVLFNLNIAYTKKFDKTLETFNFDTSNIFIPQRTVNIIKNSLEETKYGKYLTVHFEKYLNEQILDVTKENINSENNDIIKNIDNFDSFLQLITNNNNFYIKNENSPESIQELKFQLEEDNIKFVMATFKKMLKNDFILLPYTYSPSISKSNQTFNFFLKRKIPSYEQEINNINYINKVLNDNIKLSYKKVDIGLGQNYITLNIEIKNYNAIETLFDLIKFEYIETNQIFDVVGPYFYKLDLKEEKNKNKEIKGQLNFITKLHGEININDLLLIKVKIKSSGKILILKSIPNLLFIKM